MRARLLALCLLALGLFVVTGCQIEDPYAGEQTEEAISGDATVVAGFDDPATLPLGADETLKRFAAAWIDWISDGAPATRQVLSRLSASSLDDELLRAGQASSAVPGARMSGRVEGVVEKSGGRALVVTHQVVRFESGGREAKYAMYVARVQRTETGWEVAQWQPVL